MSGPIEDCTMRACSCPCHDVNGALVEHGARALMDANSGEVWQLVITEPYVARQVARQVLEACDKALSTGAVTS